MNAVPRPLDAEAQRAAVCLEAIEWVGTPYHAHGRLKGVGVDCANLIAKVYEACGAMPPHDPGYYPTAWHLHRSEELFLENIKQVGGRMVTDRKPIPGDFATWRFGRTYSHGGILVSDDGLIVHAYLDAGVICTRTTEEPLASRPVLWWTVWE
jgi:cell wall-associated NlpC family hydrolase